MNFHEPPQIRIGMGRALQCLSLSLLSTMGPSARAALPRWLWAEVTTRPGADATPYLPNGGAPPLRFQENPARPEPAPDASAFVAVAVATETDAIAALPSAVDLTPPATVASNAPEPVDSTERTLRSGKQPAAILPDDTRPVVQPEDFLPYFQLPGSGHRTVDVTVLVPVPATSAVPATLPPSSATYTQSPR